MRVNRLAAILVCLVLIFLGSPAGAAPAGSPTRDNAAPNSSSSVDSQEAFLEGYQAYGRHDLPAAIKALQSAANRETRLADYALFYLASAEHDAGQLDPAATAFRRLVETYPQSVFRSAARLELARLELKLGRAAQAQVTAWDLARRTADREIAEGARMVVAASMLAQGEAQAAYIELQRIRNNYPEGPDDQQARTLAYEIIRAHPEIADFTSLEYRRTEAALLLKEGQASMVLGQVGAALELSPLPSMRAELLWLRAEALRSNPQRAKQALYEYLAAAPQGPEAASALTALAHIYWRANDTTQARAMFSRVVRDFPTSALAPDAMFESGRTFEDDGKFDLARAEYERLLARYPSSEAAAEARFRGPFMLYMAGQYAAAASQFAAMKASAATISDRDMVAYWQARALLKSGEDEAARAIFERVAESVGSNYYPALAGRIVHAEPIALPAASAADPSSDAVPHASAAAAEFHLSRVLALRAVGLKELEPAELRALEADAHNDSGLAGFIVAELMASGAYYDAVKAAARMAKQGDLNPTVAERVRYPRAYWGLIASAAQRGGIDPYLVLAVTRQESLFNPQARSVSDARGLMQLLPSTAGRVARSKPTGALQVNLYDPVLNVNLGVEYLKKLLDMFGGDPFKAVAAYNAGENAVVGWIAKFPGDDDQWVENIGYRETRDYVKKVIGGLREYQLLYQPPSVGSSSRPAPRSPG